MASLDSDSGMADAKDAVMASASKPNRMKGMKIRDEFICPITYELMRDPVVASDGHTYEKAAIEKWLKHHQISPRNGEPMASLTIPNMNMKKLIQDIIDEVSKHSANHLFTTLLTHHNFSSLLFSSSFSPLVTGRVWVLHERHQQQGPHVRGAAREDPRTRVSRPAGVRLEPAVLPGSYDSLSCYCFVTFLRLLPSRAASMLIRGVTLRQHFVRVVYILITPYWFDFDSLPRPGEPIRVRRRAQAQPRGQPEQQRDRALQGHNRVAQALRGEPRSKVVEFCATTSWNFVALPVFSCHHVGVSYYAVSQIGTGVLNRSCDFFLPCFSSFSSRSLRSRTRRTLPPRRACSTSAIWAARAALLFASPMARGSSCILVSE